MYGFIYQLPRQLSSHMLFVQFFLLHGALGYFSEPVWHFWANIFADKRIQQLVLPDIHI